MPTTIKIRLTALQMSEHAHGLDIDADDGHAPWTVDDDRVYRGKAGTVEILDTPYAIGRAVYRWTSARDIHADNAGWSGDPRDYAHARSMQNAVDKLLAAIGGPERVPEDMRRWL